MTVIVGMIDKENKNVIIGGDSSGISGWDLTVRKDPKVFQVGDFVIGCTSSFRMMQLLRFSFSPPEVKGKEIYQYMCTDFVEAVRECFKNGGHLRKDSEGDDKGGQFLVGYKSRLFFIDSDFQVGESRVGIEAVGAGATYALGSLHANISHGYSPEVKVKYALEAANFFSAGVCKPFLIKKTK